MGGGAIVFAAIGRRDIEISRLILDQAGISCRQAPCLIFCKCISLVNTMLANLMRTVTASFAKGDLTPLFDAIDDDIVWKTASQAQGIFRSGGEYRGRAGVTMLISQLVPAYIIRRFEPKEIVCRGDSVWGVFMVEADYSPDRENPTAKLPITLEITIRWVVRNNKIVEHRTYFDTVSLLIQQCELTQARRVGDAKPVRVN